VSAPLLRWRRAQAADLQALAALYVHSAGTLGPLVYDAAQVQAWQRFGQDAAAFADYVLGACTWIADDADGALGFCGIDGEGEVRSLYVRAEATRRGIGSALLAHALQHARQQGQCRFAAWATPFSLPVFRRAGFVQVATVREAFQGVLFERYRLALECNAAQAR
jgi:putative acetyltransferase